MLGSPLSMEAGLSVTLKGRFREWERGHPQMQ